ncbi:hypothetical protein P8452_10613 [Trifolium repens]|nr:hypothetical protein P8452_10613 [Trifolium repens]
MCYVSLLLYSFLQISCAKPDQIETALHMLRDCYHGEPIWSFSIRENIEAAVSTCKFDSNQVRLLIKTSIINCCVQEKSSLCILITSETRSNVIDKFPQRKLLAHVSSASLDKLQISNETSQRSVDTSLRQTPASKSNPIQNK